MHSLSSTHTVSLSPSVSISVTFVAQRAGELVVVPRDRWHQVYTLSPSLAVAGQQLHSENIAEVVAHMRRHSQVPRRPRHGADTEQSAGILSQSVKENWSEAELALLLSELLPPECFE